jgi:hypothetical protein
MNEEPKSIWKKPLKSPGPFGAWLVLMIATVLVFLILYLAIGDSFAKVLDLSDLVKTLIASLTIATVAFCLWLFIRWLCCWRNLKRALFGLACFVTLVALFYAEEDWRGWHDWSQFKHQWEAKGEKFDYAGIIPPPVPDDQNFAMAPIWVESMKAVLGPQNSRQWFGDRYAENGRTNLVDRFDMPLAKNDSDWPAHARGNWQMATLTDLRIWQNYYRTLAAKTNLFPVAPPPQTPAQDVLTALSKYDPTIEALRAASQRPYSRFPLYANADHPFDTLLPHLAALKRCTQVLQLRAIAELQAGQSDQALADVKLALYLVNSVRTEPFLISHLVRIAILQITFQPIYEGLAEHKWSDAQLAELDTELAKFDFLADYELSMRGERICSISALDYMRRSGVDETPDFNGGMTRHKIAWFIPSAFFYQNELTIARMHQQYTLPMADPEHQLVSPAQVHNLAIKQQRELEHHVWPYKIFARMLLPVFDKVVEKFACAQSSVYLARTASALERYRLAHGEYPESLDALAPQFIAQVPHDVIDGGPLHYRRDPPSQSSGAASGQFVLYSVGWNETDDGGVVVFKKGETSDVDLSQGD